MYKIAKELQEDCYQYLILLIDFTNDFEEKKLLILNKEAIETYKKQRILWFYMILCGFGILG